MKKIFKYLSGLVILMAFISSISLGASTVSISQASKSMSDKDKDCYMLENLPMIHTRDVSVADKDIADNARDINGDSEFNTRIQLVNSDTHKTYEINLKPINGSNTTAYYRKTKQLEENTNDPYWVLKVPAGNYEIGDFILLSNT